MNELSRIKSAIREIAKVDTIDVYSAQVKSVEGDTCTVVIDDMDVTEVRLSAVVNDSDTKVIVTPSVDSDVLVADISGNLTDMVILKCSEIDSISLNGNITINGGELGGLIKIEELKTQLARLTARVDKIIDAINNAVPVAQDGGAALQTSMKTTLATITQKEDFSDIEDETITH